MTRAHVVRAWLAALVGALALVLPLAAAPPADGDASVPEVTVALDRASAAVGDRVVATYTARIPAGASLELDALVTPAPAEGAAPPAGTVLDFGRPERPALVALEGGGATWTLAVPITPFAAGTLAVPGPHLVYVAPSGDRTPVRGASTTLAVESRLPAGGKTEELAPKADRAVRVPARSPFFWVSIALAVLALAALVFWLVRRRRAKAAAAPATPQKPPAEELLEQLDRLGAAAAALGDDPRAFYSELTHATKRYLERRLDLPVLEWTTFETVRRLRERGLEPPREVGLSELLGTADRVKFGKGRATRDEARAHVERARLLCSHLEARLAPQPAAEAEAGRGPEGRRAS